MPEKTYRITRRPNGRWQVKAEGAKRATGIYSTLIEAAARAVKLAEKRGSCEIWVENDKIIRSYGVRGSLRTIRPGCTEVCLWHHDPFMAMVLMRR